MKQRPWTISFFSLILLLIGGYNLFRLLQVLRSLDLLASLPLTVSPLYLALKGLLWGAAGLVLAWGCWTGAGWARIAGMIACTLYALNIWGDLVWISQPGSYLLGWPLNLAATVVGLAGVYLLLLSRPSRTYFSSPSAERG